MKITFTDIQIKTIINLYVDEKLSAKDIGLKFNVSNVPIKRILIDNGLLRTGKSNGIKINLTLEQENKIKDLYLNHNKNCEEIGIELNLKASFINKHLTNVSYRRTKGEANSVYRTGKKLPQKIKDNMTIAQQVLAKSGKRKQTGGVCKTYYVNGLKRQGTYEKFYLEKLIIDGVDLPNESELIITPFGVYYPDFSFEDKLIEIKSDYTYDVLIGVKVSRFTKKIETKQYEKIKWVNKNVKPIEILVVDKRNNKFINKEI